MKKMILSVSMLLPILSSFAQVHKIVIRYVQNFEHPFMKTNLAIQQNKVQYKKGGTTESTYEFDFPNMKMKRTMDGVKDELDIWEIEKNIPDSTLLNVFVIFPNKERVNYICEYLPDGKKLFLCRWKEGEKIVGWFDPTAQ